MQWSARGQASRSMLTNETGAGSGGTERIWRGLITMAVRALVLTGSRDQAAVNRPYTLVIPDMLAADGPSSARICHATIRSLQPVTPTDPVYWYTRRLRQTASAPEQCGIPPRSLYSPAPGKPGLGCDVLVECKCRKVESLAQANQP